MTVYREMPAIGDSAFKAWFYQRWGHESAVICASTHRAEYPEYRQLLSIKAAFGGAEKYLLDGRSLCVDDDTFAILNQGRAYGSVIANLTPVHSFSIFFHPRLVSEVNHLLLHTQDQTLDERASDRPRPIEFPEKLYAHDQRVSPVLRYIRNAVDAGIDDPNWLEEQYLFLLERMLRLYHDRLILEGKVPSIKPSTRRELLKRVEYGVDFIHACYRDSIQLSDIASAAHMSPFHFLRTFKAVYRSTPMQLLAHKRATAAKRLLEHSDWPMSKIAVHVGLGSRTSLFRRVTSAYDMSPRELRSGIADSLQTSLTRELTPNSDELARRQQ